MFVGRTLASVCVLIAASICTSCDLPGMGSPTAAPTPDTGRPDCLPGTWRSTSESLNLRPKGVDNVPVATNNLSVEGGAGQILALRANGTLNDSYNATTSLRGQDANGVAWTFTLRGSSTGTYTATYGHINFSYAKPGNITVTGVGGGRHASDHPTAAWSADFTCVAHTSLTLTESSTNSILTFVPRIQPT